MVGYMRRNFLVQVPSFESFDALNAYLEQRCLERMDRKLRGHTETIGQRMERDLDALLPLPPVAYDACDKQAGLVSALSLVRYRTNDYSVPVACGYRNVLVRGYVDAVVISCGSEVIARHRRSYDRDDFVYDPIHYLPLLERKPGSLDQAAPLQGWALADEFGTLRRCRYGPHQGQSRTSHTVTDSDQRPPRPSETSFGTCPLPKTAFFNTLLDPDGLQWPLLLENEDSRLVSLVAPAVTKQESLVLCALTG